MRRLKLCNAKKGRKKGGSSDRTRICCVSFRRQALGSGGGEGSTKEGDGGSAVTGKVVGEFVSVVVGEVEGVVAGEVVVEFISAVVGEVVGEVSNAVVGEVVKKHRTGAV